MPCSANLGAPARIRLMGDSFVYASPGLVSRACRHSVTMLFSACDEPVEVGWRQGRVRAKAVLVAPLVSRTLQAARTPFVLFDLEPLHASFRHFALSPARASVQALTRPETLALHGLVLDFHAGRLAGPDLDAGLRSAVTTLAAAWFDPGPMDRRVAGMMGAIDCNPRITLEKMAEAHALSPTHASRLFSAEVGIPLRAYAMAAKVRAAARCMGSRVSLTEVAMAAGFADSAHFAKVWLKVYGAPPSRFFPAQRTEMDLRGLPDWSTWRAPRPTERPQP
jgi:AraC family transcriptional regulator, arabinose operon regulatory protein